MRDYYVYFILSYESENQEMGQYLRALALEIVQDRLDDREALDRARQMAPSKPYFTIQRIVHKCPRLEEQRPSPFLSPDEYVELTKDIPRDVLSGRVMQALAEPME